MFAITKRRIPTMKTSFFSTCTLLILSIFCLQITAQDNAQIGLPEGVIARIGKGSLGEIHFSPDGSKLAVSTSIGIWLHDPNTGKELDLLRSSQITRPYVFAFSPDGKTIASTGRDKLKPTSRPGINAVEVWDITTGEDKAILLGHIRPVNSIAFSPDGETIATGATHYDKTVRLWNAHTGQNIYTSNIETKWDTFVVFSPDGTSYAAAGDDNLVHLWDRKIGKQTITLTGHTKRVFTAEYSTDGKTIATVSYDGTMRFWDATTGNHNTTLKFNEDRVISIGYAPNGNTIGCGTVSGDVQLWDIQTMKLKSTLTGHTERIKSITFAPDGKTIASASRDNTIRLWDAATGETKAILTGYMYINTAVYSTDGMTIATGSGGNVQLWDANTANLKNTYTGYGRISRIAYSPDGKTIAVASPYYTTFFLVDAQTGKRKTSLKLFGLSDAILNAAQDREFDLTALAYSPDGKTIITGIDCYTHEKGWLYMWNAKTGKRNRTIFNGKGGVRTAVFSDDGTRIIAKGDWKNEIRVWHAATGKELAPTPHDDTQISMHSSFSPNGKTRLLRSAGGTLVIRNVTPTLEN